LAQGLAQYVGRNERVAVAVAADPAAHAQEGGDLGLVPGRVECRERVFEGSVEARQFAQEGGAVVGDPVLDLVKDGELRPAQEACLPQREHGTPQRFGASRLLFMREPYALALSQ
jgi:hypothetical protein